MSTAKIIAYARDAGCVLVGLGGILYQTITQRPNAQLLAVYMVLLGFTGAINVRQLRPRSNGGGREQSSSASSLASSLPQSSSGDEE